MGLDKGEKGIKNEHWSDDDDSSYCCHSGFGNVYIYTDRKVLPEVLNGTGKQNKRFVTPSLV